MKEWSFWDNSKIYIMGINHVEFGERGIKNEWVLYDETMIWNRFY